MVQLRCCLYQAVDVIICADQRDAFQNTAGDMTIAVWSASGSCTRMHGTDTAACTLHYGCNNDTALHCTCNRDCIAALEPEVSKRRPKGG
jgi:hypothetical protein